MHPEVGRDGVLAGEGVDPGVHDRLEQGLPHGEDDDAGDESGRRAPHTEDVVYLAKRESPHPIRLYSAIGRRLPAHATALGKAVLCTRDDASLAQLLPHELVALTTKTITDRPALMQELARCRSDGYAVDRSENSEDVQCYAVALSPRNGAPTTDAVSVSIPLFRLSDDLAAQTIGCLLEVNERVRKAS